MCWQGLSMQALTLYYPVLIWLGTDGKIVEGNNQSYGSVVCRRQYCLTHMRQPS